MYTAIHTYEAYIIILLSPFHDKNALTSTRRAECAVLNAFRCMFVIFSSAQATASRRRRQDNVKFEMPQSYLNSE